MAPVDGNYLTSYLIAIVMFALSLTICEKLAKIIKCQKLEHENEGNGQGAEKQDMSHSTGTFETI